ncbi:MAG: hypothetical protein IJZ27_06970 [Treponema sp.]|nr:hypothetical protein [Treponema sp.]
MADTCFCLLCGKKIGMWDKQCKYCGANQFGENNEFYPDEKAVQQAGALLNSRNTVSPKIQKRRKGFTVEEQFFFGLGPKDKMYRKGLEMEILTKNYKEQD